jgi:hypothetical protein
MHPRSPNCALRPQRARHRRRSAEATIHREKHVIHVLRRAAILAAATATTTFAFTAPAGANTGIATPAKAVSPNAVFGPQTVQDCPEGFACLWASPGWSGLRWQSRVRNDTLPSFIDNKSQSWANADPHRVACFWSDPNSRGQAMVMAPCSIRSDPVGSSANVISSLSWDNC